MAPGLRLNLIGPAPQPARYSLVKAATVVPEESERWMNGATIWPSPCGKGQVRNFCSGTGGTGETVIAEPTTNPGYDVIEALAPYECYSAGLDEDAYRARAIQAFTAQESALVEAEFLAGVQLPNNPHLSDANVGILNGGAATSLRNGMALLEKAVAAKQRRGVIHLSPAALIGTDLETFDDSGTLVTKNGTIVIPGQGYDTVGVTPTGGAAATGTQEWAYATGMVEVRRSEVEVIGDISNWIDRGTNLVRIHVHRYYLVTFDPCIQAAVKIDRCMTTC